jgi:hypothetical protein
MTDVLIVLGEMLIAGVFILVVYSTGYNKGYNKCHKDFWDAHGRFIKKIKETEL